MYSAQVEKIIDALFAPIVRLAIAKGVLFGSASELLKSQYLAAAEAQFTEAPTASRLSVMTGLQRRDISRLRALAGKDVEPAPHYLARLVALWLSDFDGVPLRRSGERSFDTLAGMIRKDVHSRTLLEQLVEAGTVSIEAGDIVMLQATTYQPLPGSEEQLAYLAQNGGDFLTASTENIMKDPAPFYERAVHYEGLSDNAVATLDAAFRNRQMSLLQDMNIVAHELQSTSPGTKRFRAGAYFYHTDDG